MGHAEPGAAIAERRVELAGGRSLVIRPTRREDADALAALYGCLDTDDQYRRFFSVYHPGRSFFERLSTVAERGGGGLVAIVTTPGGATETAGEASYTLLANGDGELEITIADRWRGWLGAYLLDALLEAAATRGVPNLEAEILITNSPMLALVRGRGCVMMERPDRAVVRVLIGTTAPTATWPGRHDRQRVLVEGPGGVWPQEVAEAAGIDVITCPGPAVRWIACPALRGGVCPLAAGADAIVIRPADEGDAWAELIATHRRLHSDVPLCLHARTPTRFDTDVPRAPDGDAAAVIAFVKQIAKQPVR